ncbi:hypothetical protein ES288_D12G072300v1 [Gossypium darwinii]|uniref:PPM-type phosphatase domain-containing protein n=2 Tax=Gossypium TaxID=3633 RepID=A0A5D2I5R7_GOSTO|nr:hypothetical protein ES288_D12G072300v1 [Gossypium darwinii]TYH37901.1 hypothetical protein ES332_D12G072900v1 [Gossypium tomentosum]
MIPVNALPLPRRGAVNQLCFRVEGSTWKISLSACSISTFPSRVSLFLHIFFFVRLRVFCSTYIFPFDATFSFVLKKQSSRLPNVGEGDIVFQLRAIHDIDTTFSKEASRNNLASGSTATIILIADGQILVANIGDSKAILCSEKFHSPSEARGSHLKVASCLLLPAIQLAVGISHPSWISLPFFIGSCIGLVDLSLTSNFLGLFRLWKALQFYAGFSIFMLYVYQLPIEFSSMLQWIADFVGLCKICSTSEWTEICSSVSLVLFYIMVCTSFITIGLILFKDFS